LLYTLIQENEINLVATIKVTMLLSPIQGACNWSTLTIDAPIRKIVEVLLIDI